jgi:hypothetical protein
MERLAYKLAVIAVGSLMTAVASCAPDHVGFVTNTSIGVGADAATGKAQVAVSRDELFIGPAYPASGGYHRCWALSQQMAP